MKLIFSTVALATVLCLAPAAVHAQDDDAEVMQMAKEHYRLGLEAFKKADYKTAIKELKRAYLLKQLPPLLLNIGATYRKMGNLDLATHFYKKYLDEAPADAKDRGEVEGILAEIGQQKATVSPEPATTDEPPPSSSKDDAPPPPRKAPAASGAESWNHPVIDAAPPDTPVDVKVAMSVMKGVKVYLFYRMPGEEDFKPVLMKRKGPVKVGRIPAQAMTGKSIQYYIEAKNSKGDVVKNAGSEADPNIIMIDPDAPPQMLASMDRRDTDAYEEPEPEDRPARGRRRSIEDEDDDAPITGRVREPRRRDRRPSGGAGKPGTLMWAGVGLLAGGALLAGGLGGAGFGLAQARASELSTACSDARCIDNQGNKIFFNNDPISTQNGFKQYAEIEAEGKAFDALGIAGVVVGSAAALTGVALIIVDRVGGGPQSDRGPKPKKRPRRDFEDEEAGRGRFIVSPTFGPTFAGAAAAVTF
jgi:hypothetical protein